jgi:hypothetical protein
MCLAESKLPFPLHAPVLVEQENYCTRRKIRMSPSMAMTVNAPRNLNIFGRPLSIFGVPVARETIFSNHQGVYKNRIEKRQRKLIIKTTFIKFFLQADERILCLTTGYAPVSLKEQVLTGPAFLFFKRAVLVFTDRRILHVPARFNHGTGCAITQIRYDDCAALDVKGRSLVVMYKNGTEETFPYIGRREKKKIASLLDSVPQSSAASDGFHRRVHLCPSCTSPLENDTQCCPKCRLEFKTPGQARMRSIFIPGGGYFYNHYSALGFTLGLIEIGLVVHLLFNAMAFREGLPVNFGTMTVILCLLVCEKIVTTFHSEQLARNLIPDSKDYAMRKV